MIEMRDVRGLIREIVARLLQVDERLAELAESLPLPPDAVEMWESQIPTSAPTHLYAALEAVRSDCIQDAIETLLHAARQSDVSLRREFLRGRPASVPETPRVPELGTQPAVGSLEKAAYPSVNHNDPGVEAGRKEPPLC